MTINKVSFEAIFQALGKDRPVALLVQQSPDPDCLGAAAGMRVLLKEVFGLDADTFHFGEISHPQNKSLKNILHISLKDGQDFQAKDHSATVVLDTDLTATGFTIEHLDVRIDHHSMDRDIEPRYLDVRPVGATCSIVWDYLRTYGIDMSKYPDTATALLLGIKIDTLDFTSSTVSELDMEAFRYLLPFVNRVALANVNKFPLPEHLFATEIKAFQNKTVKGTILTTFIGEITAHDRDIIATIADRFARMEGVDTAVVMAVVGNDLQASIRSDDSRVEVADLCSKIFGKSFSGAREGSGGARVPLGKAFELLGSGPLKESVMSDIVQNISDDIFVKLGVQK